MKWIAAVLALAAAPGCLPADTRPDPSAVTYTATGSRAVVDGIRADRTRDGWDIQFSQFVVSLGATDVEGKTCTLYSGASYHRPIDATRDESQKLTLVFALGGCSLDFEMAHPRDDSPLGDGITEDMREFLRTPSTDPYAEGAGTQIFVEGSATKDGVTKRFAWRYLHRVDYCFCGEIVDGELVKTEIEFEEGGETSVDLGVRGEVLFQNNLTNDDAPLGFEEFALADTVYGDDDGEVTIEELALVPISDIERPNHYDDAEQIVPIEVESKVDPEDGWTSLGDYLYFGLFPFVVRPFGTGYCNQERFSASPGNG